MNATRGFLVAALLAVPLVSCSEPNVPPGFIDACYGGREHEARNWVMSEARMLLTVDGKEKDWPLLASIVKDAGERQHLKVFDTSTNIPNYIRMLRVNVCDASGINLDIDKRVYLDPRANRGGPPPDDRIVTTLRTWRRDVDWKPLAEAIQLGFRQSWPGKFDVQFPPLNEATLPHMALPDNVRAELETECRAARDPKPYYCGP